MSVIENYNVTYVDNLLNKSILTNDRFQIKATIVKLAILHEKE